MKYLIRELRDMSGLTQKAFAEKYGIPLSTLRKWEQGEATPAPYIVDLIASTLPAARSGIRKIEGNEDTVYYYDATRKTVSDKAGNEIIISEDPDNVKKQNLVIYLEELFEEFYRIQNKFNKDCKLDREENILWSRKEN